MPLEDLLVDPGLVVEAFQERERRQPHQVAKSGGVLGEQREVERVLLARHAAAAPLGPSPGGDIGLQPDDRQDPRRLGFAQKLDGAVQVAMIGQCQRGHAQRFGALEQVRDLARAVQEAVMTVAMEMDERPAGHRGFTRAAAARDASGAGKPLPWVAGRSASSRSRATRSR